MRRKYKAFFFLLIASLLIGGCGAKENDNKDVNLSGQTEISVSENVDNDTEKASKDTEDVNASVEDANETGDEEMADNKELNVEEVIEDNSTAVSEEGGIVDKCPISASEKKGSVNYGEYSRDKYYSETCGMERAYSYLLPADYDESKSYPVLYLLHGIFGDEKSFTSDSNNKIKEIFGNLSSQGLAREWIVIMPNMYAKTDASQQPSFSAEGVAPYDNFINDLVNDLMPTVKERYSVLEGRDNTAIAGFSMGGRETLFISVSRPDLFGYACAISPAPGVTPGRDGFMAHEGQLSEDEFVYPDASDENAMKVLMICCGTKDSVVGKFPFSYHNILTTNGCDHIWYEVTGADHDNTAIKSGLYNFLMQIEYVNK